MHHSRNIYDKFIIFVIVSFICGTIQVSIITQNVIVGILCLPYALKELYLSFKDLRFKPLTLFIACWFSYALLSILWTVDEKRGIPDLWNIFWSMSIFLGLFHAAEKAKQPIQSFMIGWIGLLCCTFPIAIWEISTNQHIPGIGDFNADAAENFYGKRSRLFAAVTYNNLNSYVTLLCMALPIVLASIYYFKHKLIPIIVTLFTISIILINASRGGMLCVIIDFIVLLCFYHKTKFRYKFIVTVFIAIALTFFILNVGVLIAEQLFLRLEGLDSFTQDSGRWDTIALGLQLIIDSMGLGWGVGSMNEAYATTGFWLNYAHNFVIEILLQYGIVLFGAFFWLFGQALLRLQKSDSVSIRLYGWSLLCSFVPLAIIDDSYLTRPFFWCYLATVFSISTIVKQQQVIERTK